MLRQLMRFRRPLLHPRDNEVHQARSCLPPKERRSSFRLHCQIVLRVRHDHSSIRSLHAIEGSLNFRQTLIDRLKLVMLAIYQQHRCMHLLPEDESIEVANLWIPSP